MHVSRGPGAQHLHHPPFSKHLEPSPPPHYHPKSASFGSNGLPRSYGQVHSQMLGPRYIPRAGGYNQNASGGVSSGAGNIPFSNDTVSNFLGTQSSSRLPAGIQHGSQSGAGLSVNSLPPMHMSSAQIPVPASQSLYAPGIPTRPRQGRYSVTNLDFKEFQQANDVASFLRFLRLHKYIETVERQGITLMQLLSFSDQELQNIGFRTIGARTRLVKGIERFREYNEQRWYNIDSSSISVTARRTSSAKASLQEPNSSPAVHERHRFPQRHSSDLGSSRSSGTLGGHWKRSSGNDADPIFHVDSFFGKAFETAPSTHTHSASFVLPRSADSLDEDTNALADNFFRFLWVDDRSNGSSPALSTSAPDFDTISPDGSSNLLLTKIITESALAAPDSTPSSTLAKSDAIAVRGAGSGRGATDGNLSPPTLDPHFSSLPMPKTYDLWASSGPSSLSVDVSVV